MNQVVILRNMRPGAAIGQGCKSSTSSGPIFRMVAKNFVSRLRMSAKGATFASTYTSAFGGSVANNRAGGIFNAVAKHIGSVPCGALMRPLPKARCKSTGSGAFSVSARQKVNNSINFLKTYTMLNQLVINSVERLGAVAIPAHAVERVRLFVGGAAVIAAWAAVLADNVAVLAVAASVGLPAILWSGLTANEKGGEA